MRKFLSVSVGAVAGLAAVSGAVFGAVPAQAAGHTASSAFQDSWSGYVHPSAAGATSSVSTTFQVPKVSNPKAGATATVVGIDGYTSQFVAQAGVEENSENGAATTYKAFWQVDTDKHTMTNAYLPVVVAPGNWVRVSESVVKGVVSITVENVSAHTSATVRAAYAGAPLASAHFVQADQVFDEGSSNPTVSSSPNFGSVSFTANQVDGKTAVLSSRDVVSVEASPGVSEASVSSTGSGARFAVAFQHAGSMTPVFGG